MFCENCGKQISEDSLFCEGCGSKVHIETPSPEKPVFTPETDYSAQTQILEPEINKPAERPVFRPEINEPVMTDEAEVPKNNDRMINAAIIAMCLLIVLTIGTGIFLIAKNVVFKSSGGDNAKVDAEIESLAKSGLNEALGESQKEEPVHSISAEVETETEMMSETPEETEPEKEIIHRYEVIQKSCTWEEAKRHCESLGGYLATITSQSEFDEVIALLRKTPIKVAWLGAIDNSGTSRFEWVTGEPFEYAYWAVGEPNNDQGIEHYLVLYEVNGEWVWNDAPLDVNSYYRDQIVGFVCEWEEEE